MKWQHDLHDPEARRTMRLMVMGTLVAATAIVVLVAAAVRGAGTASTAWDTDTPGLYMPPCTSGGVKHFELPTTYGDKAANIHIFDLMKAAGYTNIRFQLNANTWTWSADCTLGA